MINPFIKAKKSQEKQFKELLELEKKVNTLKDYVNYNLEKSVTINVLKANNLSKKETINKYAPSFSSSDIDLAVSTLQQLYETFTNEEIDLLMHQSVYGNYDLMISSICNKNCLSEFILGSTINIDNPNVLKISELQISSYDSDYIDEIELNNKNKKLVILNSIKKHVDYQLDNSDTVDISGLLHLQFHNLKAKLKEFNTLKSSVDRLLRIENSYKCIDNNKRFGFYTKNGYSIERRKSVNLTPVESNKDLGRHEMCIEKIVKSYDSRVDNAYSRIELRVDRIIGKIDAIEINNLEYENSTINILNSIVNLIRFKPKAKELELRCPSELKEHIDEIDNTLKDYLTYKGRIKNDRLYLSNPYSVSIKHAKDLVYVINKLVYI